MTQKTNVFGFSLFNDIDDAELRTRNRAQIMHNILADHSNDQGKVTGQGAMIVQGYFKEVPEAERSGVMLVLRAMAGKPSAI